MGRPLPVAVVAAQLRAARARELQAELRLRLKQVVRFAAKPPAGPTTLLERFANVLAQILDEPLQTLAGPGPNGGSSPLELRLAHFRPDLSEQAAALLEEVGR